MRLSWILVVGLGLLASDRRAQAQPTAPVVAVQAPVTMEYYYRIKWGAGEEFKRLYAKNHAPLLREMQALGFIRSIRVDEPFTHLAGAPRWDLRVTIVFRDASAAIADPEWDRLWAVARERLYRDKALFDSEEAARFGLLEEHWDVVVNEVKPS
ncbi:MAG: hypothetical protein IPN16_24620 [Gemmatimonadetes bacterium]|nr:hypothetical protein [Gemmatimonadota bacterium]